MLHFESVFWQPNEREELKKKLESLGFHFSSSTREPHAHSIYFGPESIELIEGSTPLATLGRGESAHPGIVGLALESTDLAGEYKRLSAGNLNPGSVAHASFEGQDVPVWYGFSMPAATTPLLPAWIFMNSPAVLETQKSETLPGIHKNTCFGIEGVHLKCESLESDVSKWQAVLNKNSAGLHWNELASGNGKRFQLGERFLDFISLKGTSEHLPKQGSVLMLTLKVTELEKAKVMAQKAGAIVLPCKTRDGFVISSQWTNGPALRFVRSFWKRYLPPVTDNYPHGRRTDQFRPLGGAHSTTLIEGFQDNWKH